MSMNVILICLRVLTILGILLSFVVASQYSFIGSANEVIIAGIIGMLNLSVFYFINKNKLLN